MKTLKLFLTLALAAAVTTASAQFANTNESTGSAPASTNNPGRSSLVKDTDDYSRIYLSYTPLNFQTDVSGAEDFKMTGISLGFTKGINLAQNLPLFIEVGGNITYAFATQDYADRNLKTDDGIEYKYSTLHLKVPVSLAYRFSFKQKKAFSVTPYLGLNLRCNIFGQNKFTFSDFEKSSYSRKYDTEAEFWKENNPEESGVREKTDLFDKTEMGGKDAKWKRLQVGWQIGVAIDYKKLHIGISYGSDFSEIFKKTKIHTTNIMLGVNF